MPSEVTPPTEVTPPSDGSPAVSDGLPAVSDAPEPVETRAYEPSVEGAVAPPRRSLRTRVLARRGMIIGLAAAVVIGGGAGAGIALAATSGREKPAAAVAKAPKAGKGAGATKKTKALTRGTITAEAGSTWTVKTKKGTTVSVLISSSTHFGTKKTPASRAQFTPGSAVVVAGKNVDGKVTATAVLAPAAPGSSKTPQSPKTSKSPRASTSPTPSASGSANA